MRGMGKNVRYRREEIDPSLNFLSLYLGCIVAIIFCNLDIAYMEFGVDTMLRSKATTSEFLLSNYLRSNITIRSIL